MGGKSYFCDYCGCYMKNELSIRKKHNSGINHTIAKETYMRRFKDPQCLLMEESAKVPCTRFQKGYCKFDWFCQYSHYNERQLQELREIVRKLQHKPQKSQPVKKGSKAWEHRLPWHLDPTERKGNRHTKFPKRLPPSLRPINLKKLKDTHFEAQWG